MARPKKLSDSDLLRVAYDVSSREGFDSFTLHQVARASALSPAALVKRFKSKRQLAAMAREHRWESTLQLFSGEASARPKGLSGLRHLVSLIATSVESKRLAEHARAFGAEERSARARRKVAAYFARTRAAIGDLIAEAIADEELVNVKDTVRLAFTLEALIQGSIFQFAFLDERNLEGHMQAHIEMFLKPYLAE